MLAESRIYQIDFDRFQEIRKKEINEPIILKIMNYSKNIFPGTYELNDSQAHGECDFIDTKTNEKFELKLLFSNEACRILNKKEYDKFCETIKDYLNELFYKINNIQDTAMYKEVESRISKVQSDENLILFLPFMVSNYNYQRIFNFNDQLDYCVSLLKKDKKIYLVTLNHECQVVISDGENKECLENKYI